MRKVIKICDRCKKECDWLFAFNRRYIDDEERAVVYDMRSTFEFCEDCMKSLVEHEEMFINGDA